MSTTQSEPPRWFLETMRAAAFWTCSNRFWSARSKLVERDIQKAIFDHAKPQGGYGTHVEVRYEHFYPGRDVPEQVNGAELDIAFRKFNRKNRKHRTRIACELKVLSSSTKAARIHHDLRKLAAIKQRWPHISTFLVVFSVGPSRRIPGIEVLESDKYARVPGQRSQQYRMVEHLKIGATIDNPLYQGDMYAFEVVNVAKR
ncbi:hypothetical protein [Burkholderia glumae]|uniref:hypothetical protein n=1 Tax=Burkholderia glumae TaxID=337 RepID=UPI00156FC670|nr:hypothetical protein [Burkholderia glumae]